MSILLACRAANVAVFILVTVFYFVRSNDLWADLTPGVRLKRVGLGAVLLLISIGSANAYLNHFPPSWVTPCFTTAGLVVLLGLWLSRGHSDPQH